MPASANEGTAMPDITRRNFIKTAAGLAAVGTFGAGFPSIGRSAAKGRVVIVGAGYGGAIAARYLRMEDPSLDVVLVEQDPKYISCPLSNEVLSGERTMESLTFGFHGLASHGVKVVHDKVTEIDPKARKVRTHGGKTLPYDRLVLSPGVAFKWGTIEGYDQAASQIMPHAWEAGPQTLLLRKQIEAMKDGGTAIIVAPPNPYRCPPGPYERACQMAYYFKHHKPKSKVLILDAKDAFAKQPLFQQGWEQEYPGMISWVSGANDGKVLRVDPKAMKVFTEFGEHTGDVVNVIPPQQAAEIATAAGLADSTGWCPVDPKTFESTLHKDIHVVGDSCIAGAMPKSGYSANSQAKVCASAIVALLKGKPVGEPSYINTCYSLVAPDYGISVAAVYTLADGKIASVKDSGGISPKEATAWDRHAEAVYARSWYKNITSEMFG
jgi:sulfide dehydrogenase [flavocytochrome c] flavoprotein subunit